MNPVAIQTLPDAMVDGALNAASEYADNHMRGRFSLPLLEWDQSIRMNVSYIAAYNLITQRGMNPEAGADITFRMRYEDACKYFEGIQKQAIHPLVTQTPVASPRYEFPQIATRPQRGWT